MNGRIVKIISNLYTVACEDELYGCRARGKFRNENITPMVGDNVVIDTEKLVITDILPRVNELYRPIVANVDIGLIIQSTKKPTLDLVLLDIKSINKEGFIDITQKDFFDKFMEFVKELNESNKEVWIRQVIVPGIMDNDKYLYSLKDYLNNLKLNKTQEMIAEMNRILSELE